MDQKFQIMYRVSRADPELHIADRVLSEDGKNLALEMFRLGFATLNEEYVCLMLTGRKEQSSFLSYASPLPHPTPLSFSQSPSESLSSNLSEL